VGHWDDLGWLPCRDGKTRPVERSILPMAHGLPGSVVPGRDPSIEEANATSEARVMRLRGYGNAVIPQVAAEVIHAYMDIRSRYPR
jgi:DNA (cytosine-5)-methyltransferase 1